MPAAPRDPRTATAALDRFAPHPALRTLWAMGGAPLAFVRADERLGDRLAAMMRDDVPPIVKEDGRAISALAAVIDLANITPTNDAAVAPETAASDNQEPNDAGRKSTQPHLSTLSTLSHLLTKLREPQQSSPSSASSAPSAPLRVSPLLHSPAERPPNPVRAPKQEPTPSTTTETRKPPARWPIVRPVTIGPKSPNPAPATAGQRALHESSHKGSVLAAALGPSSPIVQSILDEHGARAQESPPTDAARTVAARLLQITEQVERKVAAARVNAEMTRNGASRARRFSTTDSPATDEHRGTDREASEPAAAIAPRIATQPPAAAAPSPRSGPAFTHAAEPTELRGFRGLAMRAIAQDTPGSERAPMLQPLHHTRQGWADVDAPDAWSLDAAARLEGLDLDEVAS